MSVFRTSLQLSVQQSSMNYLHHIPCDLPEGVGDDEQNRAGGVTRSPASSVVGRHSPVQRHQSVVAELQVVPDELNRAVERPAGIVRALQKGAGSPRPATAWRVPTESPTVLLEILGQRGRLAYERDGACFLISAIRSLRAHEAVIVGCQLWDAQSLKKGIGTKQIFDARPYKSHQDQYTESRKPFQHWHGLQSGTWRRRILLQLYL